MSESSHQPKEDPAVAARPCFDSIPYRMLVFKEINQHNVPLYLVAGSSATASKAEKALREAYRIHGGHCFYCKKPIAEGELTIDHAEPTASGGGYDIQNLLICCRPCNVKKGHRAIELFKREAGREWLSAVLRQVQERLAKLD